MFLTEDAVVVAAAPVDDARAAAVLVQEQVEVVADELHLEERVVDGHRVRGMLLLADDAPGLRFVVLAQRGDQGRIGLLGRRREIRKIGRQARGGGGDRDGRVPPTVDATTVGGTAQPGVQLADGAVQG
jgi:hypothetical protein